MNPLLALLAAIPGDPNSPLPAGGPAGILRPLICLLVKNSRSSRRA